MTTRQPSRTRKAESEEAREQGDSGSDAVLKLPNMNEFSPGVLLAGIQQTLAIIAPHVGDRESLLNLLEKVGTIASTKDAKERRKRARNVLIGMSECGLFDLKSEQFTPLAKEILDAPSRNDAARNFASHILRNLHGHALVDVIRVARERSDAISLDTIRRALRTLGFEVTTNEGNASKLRLWLQESGVVDEHWNFDERLLAELGGRDTATLKEFGALTPQQIVLLNAIREQATLQPEGSWLELSPILDLIELQHTKDFLPEGRLRDKVIKPLSELLWIEARGTGRNQGGNAGDVRPLPKLLGLDDEIPIPAKVGIPADLRPLLSTPIEKLFEDLESPNSHEKGIALELLALNILIGIGLWPVGFRLRAREAADVETDLAANGIHLQYSRWQVQCKNTSELKHDHVAREIGLATVLRAHVILMITTGKASATSRLLAAQASRQTYLQVLIIDKPALDRFRANGPTAIVEELRKQAKHVLELKKLQDPLTAGSAG